MRSPKHLPCCWDFGRVWRLAPTPNMPSPHRSPPCSQRPWLWSVSLPVFIITAIKQAIKTGVEVHSRVFCLSVGWALTAEEKLPPLLLPGLGMSNTTKKERGEGTRSEASSSISSPSLEDRSQQVQEIWVCVTDLGAHALPPWWTGWDCFSGFLHAFQDGDGVPLAGGGGI